MLISCCAGRFLELATTVEAKNWRAINPTPFIKKYNAKYSTFLSKCYYLPACF